MKRFLLLLSLLLTVLTASAKSPQLSSEKLFDGRYTNKKDVSISIYRGNGVFFRSISVSDNSDIMREIESEVIKDLPRSTNYSDQMESDFRYIVMTIQNNGAEIQIGYQRDGDKEVYLFIRGPERAFNW